MRSIAFVSRNPGQSGLAEFTSALIGAGFRVRHFNAPGNDTPTFSVEELEACSAVVVDTRLLNLNLCSYIAYLIGRGKHVWIICDEAEKLPDVLKKAAFISSKAADKGNLLVNQIRAQLSIDVPEYETVTDFPSLISWIAEEPKRIADLSSKDFETFVLLLLSKLGLHYNSDLSTSSGDLVFSDPTTSTSFLVESKNYVSGRKVGIGEIERCVANAMNLRCDFSVLVSASEFTRSAREYAKLCAPPVWLLGRENLEFLVSGDLESTTKLKASEGGLFRWIISKRDRVSDASPEDILGVAEYKSLQNEDESSKAIDRHIYFLRDAKRTKGDLKLKYRVADSKCEVFLSFGRQEKSGDMNKQILQLARDLDGSGIRVWHDSPSLDVGIPCLRLPDVASAVKRSDVMLYFFDPGVQQSMRGMKTLQTVALQLSQSPESQMIVFVIGDDSLWNRLRLPSMFSESTFLDPYRSEWKSKVLKVCQRFTNLKESAGSDEPGHSEGTV